MQQPLQITFRGMESSTAIEQRVRDKVADLERVYDQITSCHVIVEAPHQQHHKGNLYSVHMDIRVPDKEIVVGRDPLRDHAYEDVYVALRDAFATAVRQLEDYARRRRGQVKRHEPPDRGQVAKLFDGYGFVEMPDGTEVYFHENSVGKPGFSSLEIGDLVRVVIAEDEGEKGPQASAVTPSRKRRRSARGRARPAEGQSAEGGAAEEEIGAAAEAGVQPRGREPWPGASTPDWDEVDEASWESFPASDPPPW